MPLIEEQFEKNKNVFNFQYVFDRIVYSIFVRIIKSSYEVTKSYKCCRINLTLSFCLVCNVCYLTPTVIDWFSESNLMNLYLPVNLFQVNNPATYFSTYTLPLFQLDIYSPRYKQGNSLKVVFKFENNLRQLFLNLLSSHCSIQFISCTGPNFNS